MKHISSLQNPLIKKILQLKDKGRLRKQTGLFVVEGVQEIELALQANYVLDRLLFRAGTLDQRKNLILEHCTDHKRIEVDTKVYEKIAHRGSTEGILAVFESRPHGLGQLEFGDTAPLLLVAEAPEKPGNLGALFRTARAAQVDAVIIANPRSDLYHPNIIRSSVGCLFGLPIALASSEETLAFLKVEKIQIYAAFLQGSVSYLEADFTGPCALVVGTESTGLESLWLQEADQRIHIPMAGEIDSLNVSVAAAILMYEALRQRTNT